MESKSYTCLRYRKNIKSTSNLTRYINACKNAITLPNCQILNSTLVLKYNKTSHSNFLLNNNIKNISLEVSKNGKKKIRLANIDNNKKDIRPADIDNQWLATPYQTL